ncbi:MAG: ATP-binding cassette domain-containing protein [Pseudomonadota bacterium]
MTPILSATQLTRCFDTVAGPLPILTGVDLAVAPGEAVAIVGASGSGKSTLLGLLAGLDNPDHGSVELGGRDLSNLDEDARAALRSRLTAFVFQAFHLLDDLTAEENVALPLELFGRAAPQATAAQWLERLGLGERRNHFPRQLSGGEQQRVGLARAFALEPALLFADEPTANLDRSTARTVVDSLFDLQQHSTAAMVLVTHDESVANRCDRVLELRGGTLQ